MKVEERHLEITTIAGCKISCSYCPQAMFALEHKKVSNNRLMTLETFKKSLSSVPIDVDIHFSGYSEPFLNPDCIDMIKFAYQKGHEVSVYTTVEGLKTEHVRELEQLKFKKFNVHLPDDGVHMRVRIDESYLEVMKLLMNSHIPNILYIDYFGVHPEVLSLMEHLETVNRKLTSRAGNVSNEETGSPPIINGALWCPGNREKKNVLLPNGDVSLCCVDYGKRHIIGNLMRDNYDHLHKSEAFKEVIARMNGKKGDLLCRTCEWAEPITIKHRLKKLIKSRLI
ncbi:MAG: radical SAM protein [Cytophagales bacterium]|nr:radical SAM protein [Cytophagales bacterium]